MIRTYTLAEARAWIGAGVPDPAVDSLEFDGVSTDTRVLGQGQLFVALRGDRFDGHRFLEKARAAGAVAAVVDCLDRSVDLPQLVVEDTVTALAQLAAGNRNESHARFVAVTGSAGKTTVREMVASVLSRMAPTLATRGNLNNHIGVPLRAGCQRTWRNRPYGCHYPARGGDSDQCRTGSSGRFRQLRECGVCQG